MAIFLDASYYKGSLLFIEEFEPKAVGGQFGEINDDQIREESHCASDDALQNKYPSPAAENQYTISKR